MEEEEEPSARLAGILCGWTPADGNSGSSRLTPPEKEEEELSLVVAGEGEEAEEAEEAGLGLIGVGMRLAEEAAEEGAEEEPLSISADVSHPPGYFRSGTTTATSTTPSLANLDLGDVSTTRGSIRTGS